MSARQIDSCAARLQPADAERFRANMLAAAMLLRAAADLRREAWRLYRGATGLQVRDGQKRQRGAE